jgi:hypothetical protein
LVADSRWDTTEQGRHFGTSLSEAEDVIDEEKHILAFLITEVFGNSQTGQSNTSTSTRWFVHLTEHERDLGLAIELND